MVLVRSTACLILSVLFWTGVLANARGATLTFKLDSKLTFRAPEGSLSILQYYVVGDVYEWRQWVKPKGRPAYPLPESGPNDANFESPAVWHSSPDGVWLFRTQRTGSGTDMLLLYRSNGMGNVKPIAKFDDQAYEFYARHSGLDRNQCVIDHCWMDFVRWTGSHRVIVRISGQSTMCQPMWVTDDWLMGYDCDKEMFFLTEDLIDKNERRLFPAVHPTEVPAGQLR